MKYLDSLRKKKGVKVEQKKAETPHHDELQKVQKGVFTVFAVQQGSTFSEKAPCDECKHKKTIPGTGDGCVYKTGGEYHNIWTLLDTMGFCPRGYWH
jgi:hypothetical protein